MNRSAIKADWYEGLPPKEITEKHKISLWTLYSVCKWDNRRKRAVAKHKGSICPICGAVILIATRRKYCDDECRNKGLREQLCQSYEEKKRKYDTLAEWLKETGSMSGLTGYLGYASYDSMRFQIKRFARENNLVWPPQVNQGKEDHASE